ncbi:MAG: ion transporter [Planctomycetota bacterium]
MSGWRARWHEVIFEADTPAGKAFDVGLMICILLSITAVILESVESIRAVWGQELKAIEWSLTVLFTIEYVLRILTVGRPMRYALSFFGVVDLLSIVPTYLSVIYAGSQSLIVIRALRLLRVFRVLKLAHFVGEAALLRSAIRASWRKIAVFLGTVLTLMLIIGALMYLVESEQDSGFTSIPRSIYWAIVTMTTVGYGDIAPKSIVGQVLASLVMILGYGIIAVPTGIVTVEMSEAKKRSHVSGQACPECSGEGHDPDARHCKHCGAKL